MKLGICCRFLFRNSSGHCLIPWDLSVRLLLNSLGITCCSVMVLLIWCKVLNNLSFWSVRCEESASVECRGSFIKVKFLYKVHQFNYLNSGNYLLILISPWYVELYWITLELCYHPITWFYLFDESCWTM